MKAARLVVLGVAVAAGGLAALLAGRSGDKPAPAPEPVVQFETIDVLVANQDLSAGSTLKPEDLRWQMWPAASAGPTVIRKNDRPDAIEQLTGYVGAQFLYGGRADPGSAPHQGQRRRLSRRHPADRHARDRDRNHHRNRRRRLRRARRSCRRASSRAATAKPRSVSASRPIPAKPSSRMCAFSPSIRPSRTRTARKSSSARPRRSNWRRARPKSLALGRQIGTLSLALRSVVDTGKNANDGDDDKRGGINMVRFGVTTTRRARNDAGRNRFMANETLIRTLAIAAAALAGRLAVSAAACGRLPTSARR